MISEVGRLLDQWADQHEVRPNMSHIARRVGVSRGAVSRWYAGSAPTPDNLRALATLTGIPYARFTDAVLADLGYFPKESDRDDPAPKTAAEWDRRATGLRAGARPLSDRELVRLLGPRPPGEVLSPGSGGVADEGGSRQRRA